MHRITIITLVLINSFPLLAQNFSYKKTPEGIEISEGSKRVLFYQTKLKTVEGKYERSGYIHPLYDLQGNVLTEDSPEDHPYHRGIFTAWHQIIVDGKSVADGWMSQNISFETGKTQVTKSPKNTILSSAVNWKVNDSGKTTNIISETDRINIFTAKDHYRIIDFNIFIKPLVPNIQLGGSDDPKGYGGFCLRLKLPPGVKFVSTGNEVTPQDTAVTAGPWMDMQLDGTGVAVFAYREESPSQQRWILRKEKSMQNIPFPGRHPMAVPQEGWHLSYRVIIHDDQLTSDDIQRLYDEYKTSGIK